MRMFGKKDIGSGHSEADFTCSLSRLLMRVTFKYVEKAAVIHATNLGSLKRVIWMLSRELDKKQESK